MGSIGPGGRDGRGGVHRVAPGRGAPGQGAAGPGRRQPGHGPSREPRRGRGPLRVGGGGPRLVRGGASGRRGGGVRLPPGGDPERAAVGRRADRVARGRADRHAESPGGVAAGGRPSGDVRRVEQRLWRSRGAAQARGHAPSAAQPVCGGEARRGALRPRLRTDDGARWRQPPLFQRLRPAPGPLQPVQRRDLGCSSAGWRRASGRGSTATGRRRGTSPTWRTSWPRTSWP